MGAMGGIAGMTGMEDSFEYSNGVSGNRQQAYSDAVKELLENAAVNHPEGYAGVADRMVALEDQAAAAERRRMLVEVCAAGSWMNPCFPNPLLHVLHLKLAKPVEAAAALLPARLD